MGFKEYSIIFTEKCNNLGYSAESIKRSLDYAEVLYNKNLPIIYNITHLSSLSRIKKEYILKASQVSKYSDAYYRAFKILKKNKTEYRTIREPLPTLKRIQFWILNNILEKISISKFNKGYVKKMNLKTNVRFHRKKKIVLNLDIKNFFDNIKFEHVEKVFIDLGYSKTVSNTLAKICCLNDSLPQGAPTSPLLTCKILEDFDNEVGAHCLNLKIAYTRYADDMSFSGDFDFNSLISFVEQQLKEKLSLEINTKKTSIMFNSQRQFVTGIIVNDKIQLSKKDRNNLRLVSYYITNKGLEAHCLKNNIEDQEKYLNQLIGKVNFGLFLNKNDGELNDFKTELLKLRRGIL